MALIVFGARMGDNQLLVRDTTSGTVSWKPGTPGQVVEANTYLSNGETYDREYIRPPAEGDDSPTPIKEIGGTPYYPEPKAPPVSVATGKPVSLAMGKPVKLDASTQKTEATKSLGTMNEKEIEMALGRKPTSNELEFIRAKNGGELISNDQLTAIAQELRLPVETIMAASVIAIPAGGIAGASPEPITKTTAFIILIGLITAYGAVWAYRRYEDSENAAAQEAVNTAKEFEAANGRPLSQKDIVYATSTGSLFSLEEGTIKTDTSHDKSQYEVKHSTAEAKDQTIIATSTAGAKSQTVIKTSTASPKSQIPIKTDTFDPTSSRYIFKNITAVVMVAAPRVAKVQVMERAIDFDRVLSGLVDDYNRQEGIIPQAGERPLSGSRYANAFQKYLDTTAANAEAGSRTHSAYRDYLLKKAALYAAWRAYIQSANPTPVSGSVSTELLRAAALYQMNQYIEGRRISAATKQAIKTAIQETIESQTATSTATQTQTQEREQTKAQTTAATQSATKAATKSASASASRTAARTAEQTATQTLTAGGELPELKPDGEKEDNIFTEADGAVAWRQGIGWWVFTSPYNRPQDRRFLLKKPVGATITADAKSAIGTIQAIGGKAPINTKFDMGVMDVKITSAPRTPSRDSGRAAIKFARDADKSYGGQGTSKRFGPYHYKDGKVSRKPID
jgi:hypothetical protein